MILSYLIELIYIILNSWNWLNVDFQWTKRLLFTQPIHISCIFMRQEIVNPFFFNWDNILNQQWGKKNIQIDRVKLALFNDRDGNYISKSESSIYKCYKNIQDCIKPFQNDDCFNIKSWQSWIRWHFLGHLSLSHRQIKQMEHLPSNIFDKL